MGLKPAGHLDSGQAPHSVVQPEGKHIESNPYQARTQDFQKGGSDCGDRRSPTRGSGGAAPRR